MSFKPFFVHRFHGPGKMPNRNPRGFTCLVSPCDAPNMVHVQIAWCSPKDQFCKKEGRSFAGIATLQWVNKRALAAELAAHEYACNLTDTMNEGNWNYVYKYLL